MSQTATMKERRRTTAGEEGLMSYQPSTFRCAVCSRFVPLRKVWATGEATYLVEPHGSCTATTRAIPVVDLRKAMHDRRPGSARRVVAWLAQTIT